MEPGLRLRAEHSYLSQCINFHIFDIKNNGEVFSGEPLVMKRREEGTISPPSFSIQFNQAQSIMNELWAMGIRPSDHLNQEGLIGAKDKHIDDLRKIAFNVLEID